MRFRELHLSGLLMRTLYGASLVLVGPVVADVRSQEAAPGASPLAPCDSVALRPDKGGIAGVVRIANGTRAASATIVVAWSELGIAPDRTVQQRTATLSSRANADGAYAICGVPAATRLVAFASTEAGDTTGYILTEAGVGRMAQVDFRIPGQRADASGKITEIVMVPTAVVLDSVRTVATRLDLHNELAGFEQRRRSGNGYFLTESQIADMHPTRNADIVRRIPGLRVITKRGGFSPGVGVANDSTFVVKAGSVAFDVKRSTCRVDVIVDGLRKNADDLEILPPSSIRAIEVHDVASLPPQFRGGMCGALMIWTKQ